MASKLEDVTDAVILAIQSIGLVDEQDTPQSAQVKYRDIAEINPRIDLASDLKAAILVSPARINQASRFGSTERVLRLFPVQITFFGVGNKAPGIGKRLVSEWKETVWATFLKRQPLILKQYLPNLYDQQIVESAPLEDRAWREMYIVQAMFVMVWLELNIDSSVSIIPH